MDIGINIRKIRELKGYSQDYMATALEISQRQFSRIEKNETDLSLSKLEKISEVLEVSPSQIMGFDEKYIFQNCQNVLGNENQQINNSFSEKERELYEKLINSLKEQIETLKKTV